MIDADYVATQQKVRLLAQALLLLDTPAFLERLEKAETLGPFIEPTLYRDGMEPLGQLKQVAEALNKARTEILRVKNRAEVEKRIREKLKNEPASE